MSKGERIFLLFIAKFQYSGQSQLRDEFLSGKVRNWVHRTHTGASGHSSLSTCQRLHGIWSSFNSQMAFEVAAPIVSFWQIRKFRLKEVTPRSQWASGRIEIPPSGSKGHTLHRIYHITWQRALWDFSSSFWFKDLISMLPELPQRLSFPSCIYLCLRIRESPVMEKW